jgi:hypothetical protein
MYYVYALWEEGKDHPFYIGKGKGDRFQQHFQEAASWDGESRFRIMPNGDKYWYNVAKLSIIKKDPSKIKVTIIEEGLSESKAFKLETLMVATYGPSFDGGVLTNMTWGGDGVSMTEEVRKKISQYRLGKKHTEEFKTRHREMFSGEKNPFYGRAHSEETKIAVSRARVGKGIGERNAMSRAEVRDKISGKNNVNYNIKPYLTTAVSSSEESTKLWKSAGEFYEQWISNGRPGYVKLSKLMGLVKPHKCLYMVNHFKSGWVPFEDEEWVQWKT